MARRLSLLMLVWASLVLMAEAIPMPKALSASGIEDVMGRPGGASDVSNVPEQVHITQGKHPGSLIIGWATQGKGVPVVRYGLKSGVYEWKALGTTETYVRGNYTSPHIHHAKVSGLSPSTTYYYAIGDEASGARELYFTTLPAVGATKSLTFTVIGDLGQTEFSENTVMHVLADPKQQFTIIAGDLSYADGDQPRWDRWGNLFEPLISTRVFQPAVGNHEIEIKDKDRGVLADALNPPRTDGKTTFIPFQSYQARFKHAGPEPKDKLEGISSSLWYSYSAGPAHFIHLSSYSPFGDGSPQKLWLASELASIDHQATPWVFAILHAPWYNSNLAHHDEPEEFNMRNSMESMLCKGGVDAVFAGHVHAYERVGPAYNGSMAKGGITYINVGDGGNREGLAVKYIEPQPAWSIRREASYGHGKIEIINGTTAVWTWHRIQDGELIPADVTPIPPVDTSICHK